MLKEYPELPLTIGIIVRMLFVALTFFYILHYFYKRNEKKMLYANIVIIGYFIIHFLINFIFKGHYDVVAEISFLAKAAYPFQLFFFSYIFLKNNWSAKEKIFEIFTFNLFMLSMFVIIPTKLGLSFESYSFSYEGSIGWFNAANEISAILAYLLPFVILTIHQGSYRILGYITISAAAYSSYLIGTKVSLGSTILILLGAAIFLFLKNKYKLSKPIIFIVIPLIALVISLNQAPAVKNIQVTQVDLEEKEYNYQHKNELFTAKEIAKIERIQELKSKSLPLLTKVLSSRDIYALQHFEYFKDAPLSRQLLGLGYASEYYYEAKMIEMDFFDFLFSFGLIGTSILLFVLSRKLGQFGKVILSHIRHKDYSAFVYFLCLSFLFLCTISFLAGHVIFAPSVSIYLAISLAFIFILVEENRQKK